MADAGVNEIQNMVNRIQTLATQAASSNNAGELPKLEAERGKLISAIDKIAASTKYNGVALLNGTGGVTATSTGSMAPAAGVSAITLDGATAGQTYNATFTIAAATLAIGDTITLTNGADPTDAQSVVLGALPTGLNTSSVNFGNLGVSLTINSAISSSTGAAGTVVTSASSLSTFQVGADDAGSNQVTVDLTKSYTSTALGLGVGNINTQAAAQSYITTSSGAMDLLITQRADLGATQNQLGFIQANLATSIEQTTASVSSIKDADMAMEMANFTKNKILTQAGTSMLAQANQAAQNVMTLFR